MADNIIQRVVDPIKEAKGYYNKLDQDFNELTDKTKMEIETNGNVVNGIQSTQTQLPNSVKNNPYSAKVLPENPKNFSASDGTYSNVNINDLVIPYENVLMKYHQVTWNFSLYALDKDDFITFWESPGTPLSRKVIAQSGVTSRYSIDSVQMTTAGPATPGMTTNYNFNKCVVNISEQNGMSLYSELVVLSNELGYMKFMDVPMILELNFVGYEQEGGEPMIIPNINRKWSVRINNIQAHASQSGSTMKYALNLTSNRAGIVDNKDWTLNETLNCTSATFGEFCSQIEQKLNKMAQDQYGYLAYRYDAFADGKFFEVIVGEDIKNMQINYDAKQSKEVGNTPSGQAGAKNFTWGPNVPFSRAIDDVLDCCIPVHENADLVRQFVNIIPVQHYVGYDDIRNTSAYKVKFYIVRYKIGDIVSEDDLKPTRFNFEYFFENAEKYIDPNDDQPRLNMKRYDYQFSGVGAEILDLQLKFDQQFSVAVTRNPSTQQEIGNRSGTHTAEILELGDVRYDTSVKTNVQAMWKKSRDIKDRETNGEQISEEDRQFVRDVESYYETRMKVGDEDEQDRINLARANPLPEYIEDYREIYDLTQAGTDGIGARREHIETVPIEPEQTKTVTSGAENDNSTEYEMNRRLLRDNYYSRPFLGKLDMKVVGDPYWLGWSDYSYLEYLERIVNGDEMAVDITDFHYANYINTEAYLLLNIKPVVSISDETGILDLDIPSTFSQTIYRVNSIVSDFGEGGSFTQQISGAIQVRSLRRRDTIIDNDEGTGSTPYG